MTVERVTVVNQLKKKTVDNDEQRRDMILSILIARSLQKFSNSPSYKICSDNKIPAYSNINNTSLNRRLESISSFAFFEDQINITF